MQLIQVNETQVQARIDASEMHGRVGDPTQRDPMHVRDAVRENARKRRASIDASMSKMDPATPKEVLVLYDLVIDAKNQRGLVLNWLHIAGIHSIYQRARSILSRCTSLTIKDKNIKDTFADFILRGASRTLEDIQRRGIYEQAAAQIADILDPETREYAEGVFPTKAQFVYHTIQAIDAADECIRTMIPRI